MKHIKDAGRFVIDASNARNVFRGGMGLSGAKNLGGNCVRCGKKTRRISVFGLCSKCSENDL